MPGDGQAQTRAFGAVKPCIGAAEIAFENMRQGIGFDANSVVPNNQFPRTCRATRPNINLTIGR